MPDNATEIRPGVFRPDWEAITRPAARQALAGRAAARAGLLQKWSHRLDDRQDLVWRATLRLYANLGRAPEITEIAADTGVAVDRVAALLGELEKCDLLALDPRFGQVRLAYPFTQAATEHQVELRGRALYALCAIDALGTGAIYGADTTIRSQCRHCGQPIHVRVTGAGRVLGGVEPAGGIVWYDFAYDGSAASSCCPSIAFFCSDAHLEQAQSAHPSRHSGVRLTIDEALELGRAIFGPVLAEAH